MNVSDTLLGWVLQLLLYSGAVLPLGIAPKRNDIG